MPVPITDANQFGVMCRKAEPALSSSASSAVWNGLAAV
jgi:hypothetical protein